MGQTGQNVDAAQAVAAAIAQIELAVREVQPAVQGLGALIASMASGLVELKTARPGNLDSAASTVSAHAFDSAVTSLEKHVHGSITHLQFYDRLVQHLSHVQDYLSGTAGHLGAGSAGDEAAWGALRDKLRVRLISQAQRQLLDAVLPPPGGAQFNSQQARDEHAAQGTVELF